MADKSGIEWTDATWNPVRGCTRVSRGCGGPGDAGGCYAEIMAARFSKPGQWGHGFATMKGGDHRWTGKVAPIEDMLTVPLHWKKPRRIFVNSTSDLFHEALSDEAIDRIFAVMALCPQHTFQILTKRPERMQAYLTRGGNAFEAGCHIAATNAIESVERDPERRIAARTRLAHSPLPNVWLGTSVEDQERADERVPHLLATPTAVRFLSCEPLLGPIDLSMLRASANSDVGVYRTINSLTGHRGHNGPCGSTLTGINGPRIDWVIAGGESGPGARPMHPDWARSLRDQCAAAAVPFFFKQWGEWEPREQWSGHLGGGRFAPMVAIMRSGEQCPDDMSPQDVGAQRMARVGKSRAGRELDCRVHDEYPQVLS